MIRINAILIEADVVSNGYVTSVGACELLVKKFKEKGETITVRLGKTQLVVGKVVDLEYDKERKVVIGVMELNLHFVGGGQVLQKLSTPEGTRVLECSFKEVAMILGGING
jgi:hypothetical protein